MEKKNKKKLRKEAKKTVHRSFDPFGVGARTAAAMSTPDCNVNGKIYA